MLGALSHIMGLCLLFFLFVCPIYIPIQLNLYPPRPLCRKCHGQKGGEGGGGGQETPRRARRTCARRSSFTVRLLRLWCTSYAFTTIDLLHYSSPIPTSPPPPPSHPPPHPSILKRVAGIFGSQGSRRTFLCSEGRRYHTPGLRTFPGTAYCGQRR